MKTIGKSLLLTGAILIGAISQGFSQIIVNVIPPRPRVVVTRPAPPAPGYVWIEEDWQPRGRGYAWHGGYWAAPPRPQAAWAPGYWRRSGRGHAWAPGHWNYNTRVVNNTRVVYNNRPGYNDHYYHGHNNGRGNGYGHNKGNGHGRGNGNGHGNGHYGPGRR
jgi:hypothetical protein